MSQENEFERVYTVADYYDGPRSGIADFRAKPHFYECEWDAAHGNYSDVFRLSPIDSATLALAMEDWAIWLRWELAFNEGRAEQATHPALPEDRARHEELERVLAASLRADPTRAVRARATFQAGERGVLPAGVLSPLRVRWSPAAADARA